MIYTLATLGKRTMSSALLEALSRNDSLCASLVGHVGSGKEEAGAALKGVSIDEVEDRRLLLLAAANSGFEEPNELDLLATSLVHSPALALAWERVTRRDAAALREIAECLAAEEGAVPTSLLPTSYEAPSADALILDTYAENLNLSLAGARRRPVIGRDAETDMLETILLRFNKPNAFLLGEAGVGKTAVVEGFVQRILDHRVDPSLRACTVYSLDVAALVGGTGLVGAFEERVRKLFRALASRPDVIVWVDEIHMAKGAGAATGNATDLLELLKKPLGRGEFRAIVATTQAEYDRFLAGNKAFARRFQYLTIDEPGKDAAVEILEGWAEKMSRHYRLAIGKEAIEEAVALSAEFVPERRLPDKAIDVLDFAASLARRNGASELGQDHLREAFMRLFKVPRARLGAADGAYFAGLAKAFSDRLVGQPQAVEAVVRHVRNGRLGLREPDKPLGMLLFAGPTGVGKTELATLLRDNYYADAPLIVFNMGEYQEPQDVAKLLGTAPGLVGYDDGGKLVSAIRRNPNAILLLDEIEKAHKDVFDILLGVFDKAELRDNRGDIVSARSVFFIMTTNLLSPKDLARRAIGFGAGESGEADMPRVNERLLQRFRPEFLNRLDEVIVFKPLDQPSLERVAALRLEEYLGRVRAHGVGVSYGPDLPGWLASRVKDRDFGARPLKRLIEKEISGLFVERLIGMQPNGRKEEFRIEIGGDGKLRLA